MDALIEKLFVMVPMATMNFMLNVAIIGVLFYGIRPVLKDLAAQVRKTNGTVISLNQWKDDHSQDDNRRHVDNLAALKDIKDELRDQR